MTATKSWGPTPTEKLGREVANQVAAPTEARTPTKHRANIAHKECGWKDGDRGGLAEWEQIHGKKKCKCALTSTGLLMEGFDRFRMSGFMPNAEICLPRDLIAHLDDAVRILLG